MKSESQSLVIAKIEPLIQTIRGQKVILAADLAHLYGVETRVLNQAVKRNQNRFPEDFMFQLNRHDIEALTHSTSQFVILNPAKVQSRNLRP